MYQLVVFYFALVLVQPEEVEKTVIIDLQTQKMAVYENNVFIREIRVSTGKKGFETPYGEFAVMSKDKNHKSSKYPEETNGGWPMPYALRFNGWEYWIHEGSLNSRSHGCVRVSRANAKWLFSWATIGTKVEVYK